MRTVHIFFVAAMSVLATHLGPGLALAQLSGGPPTIDPTGITELSFGDVIIGSTAGSVMVRPDGSLGPPSIGVGHLGGQSAAAFDITGPANTSFSIVLPGSATVTNGGHSMTVRNFTTDVPTGRIAGSGASVRVSVGATLDLNANQASGDYFGSFLITVNP